VNGKDTLLVTDEIPSGMLSQIRLILGENNSVMVDSIVYDIKTPSAQESGLKLNVHQDITPAPPMHIQSILMPLNQYINGKRKQQIYSQTSHKGFLRSYFGTYYRIYCRCSSANRSRSFNSGHRPENDTTTTMCDTAGQFLFQD